ncbi:DNA-binding protein [Geminocystis sp. CENA526]|uniref:helix-turn-helix domain-containing transcriptional regulator n=1 Tax=Geminocystis sp. CENA526 TaxID=1355871 RepID=UPI003D6F2EA0
MKTAESLTTRNYHDFLIESLCDSEEIASYIETVLEEENCEPKLLLKVLENAIEAHKKINNISELAIDNYHKLYKGFDYTNGDEIFTFLDLLKELGLSLSVNVKNNN